AHADVGARRHPAPGVRRGRDDVGRLPERVDRPRAEVGQVGADEEEGLAGGDQVRHEAGAGDRAGADREPGLEELAPAEAVEDMVWLVHGCSLGWNSPAPTASSRWDIERGSALIDHSSATRWAFDGSDPTAWLGREDSNLRYRIQSPLPYPLA